MSGATGGGWADRAARVLARCDELAGDSDEPGRLVRTYLSPATTRAQARLRGWFEAAGLTVRLDAAGNLVGERPPGRPGAGVLWLGSHLDTVVDAGRYDGQLGVLAALEIVDALRDAPLAHGLAVVAFTEEEGVRFGAPYLGSKALAGTFEPELLELRDADGVRVADALRGFGLDPSRLAEARLDAREALGFVELHIEQGPVLDDLRAPLAPAGAIAGQSRLRLRFGGHADHAGTTPMRLRRDALLGAAAFALAVDARARSEPELVATVGRLEVTPNAPNVVPAAAHASLDVRHPDDAVRAAARDALLAEARRIADERGLELRVDPLLEQAAVTLDAGLTARLETLTGRARLVSGAGHDAAVMAAAVPTALLFVRSPGGVSHHPDEGVRAEDVAEALRVLTELARDPDRDPDMQEAR